MNHSRYSQDALKQCQDEIANLKYELAMSKHALASLKQQAHKHEKQSELFSELRTMTLQELAESQQENASLRLQIENMVSSQSLRRTSYTPMNGSHQKDAEEALIAILNQDSDGQGSIGPVIVTPGYLPFSLLPDEIQSIDSGMNALPAIKSAPMRFIRLDSFLSWTSLVVYEEVKQADMIEVPYEDVDDEQWSRAAVLSWRWHASKPWTYEQYLARPGFSPMSQEQFSELQGAVGANRSFVDRIWIDWSCVPQYFNDSMTEVLRSKIFYARSRLMLVLPTFLPLPQQAVLCALLGQVQSTLILRSTNIASAAAKCIEAIMIKRRVGSREYFARVWTLAERIARYGRNERLCNWLSLEAWIGMVLDAAFSSIDDDSSMAVYTKILGVGSQPIMAELTPLLHKSVFNGTLKSSKIKELMADLCEIGVKSWLPSSSASLVEAPNVQWLKSYLGKEATSGIYQAFSQDDRVWSIYTYFVWKPVIEKSREALRWALDLLVHLIDDDKEAEEEARAEGMYIQLELEANPEGWTPLHRACAFGRTQTVKNLIASMSTDKEGLEDRDNESYTPLHLAAKAGHAEIVRILLEAGARVNAEDNLGYTALMYSAGSGLEGSDHERAVVLLLEGGANIDHHAHDGYTALLWASASGLEESVKFLIKSGADLEARDNSEDTALTKGSDCGYERVVRTLLEAGADHTSRDIYGNTALNHACRNGYESVVKLLVDAGADMDVVDMLGKKPMDWAVAMGHSSIVDLLSKAKESREVIVIPSQLLMPKGNDDPEGDSADVFEL